MDFPFNVCTDCFERSGKSKSKVPLLLASECLEKTRHKCVTVRVRLVDGILDPEIRPVPKAHFTGEFVLCDPKKCHRNRGNCKYPHCLKEKAAWNAEKFGVSAIFSPVTPTSSSASAHATEGMIISNLGIYIDVIPRCNISTSLYIIFKHRQFK